MTEKRNSGEHIPYNYLNQTCNELIIESNKLSAFLMLMLPVGLPYEIWKELHMIKGDWID